MDTLAIHIQDRFFPAHRLDDMAQERSEDILMGPLFIQHASPAAYIDRDPAGSVFLTYLQLLKLSLQSAAIVCKYSDPYFVQKGFDYVCT